MDSQPPTPSVEEGSQATASQLRQPKKRFVGRRTADAQAQKDTTGQDVESTAVQTGMHIFLESVRNHILTSVPFQLPRDERLVRSIKSHQRF
jgi:hypothetical protein